MNKQREIIYGQRRQILEGADLKENILEIVSKIVENISASHLNASGEFNLPGFLAEVRLKFGMELAPPQIENLNAPQIKERLNEGLVVCYEEKEKAMGKDLLRHLERMVFLQIIDSKWKDHLYAMDSLREGIGLRAYGQRDPLVEYKREAFDMFSQMVASIEEDAIEAIFKLQPAHPQRFKGVFSLANQELIHSESDQFKGIQRPQAAPDTAEEEPVKTNKPVVSSHSKVGRNDPCPCGSGKKYKKCCGS